MVLAQSEIYSSWEYLPKETRSKLKSELTDILDKYNLVVAEGKEKDFNEEDVKVKFINPFLEVIGWDVRGLDEVKFEQRTLSGRVDFGLRTEPSSKPMIFIEIKKFQENLDGYRISKGRKRTYAEIAIDYAWQMKVDWCVLTNFKELRLYYTHVSKPTEGLIYKLKCDTFTTEGGLSRIWDLSKGRISKGVLDTYERRRTREDVTTEVVNDLYKARKKLTGNINKNNNIEKEELRDSVQRILDRLVVIRVAEDRGIITPETLLKRVTTWKETAIDKSISTLMRDLKNIFRDFDSVYNSKLFEEHKSEILRIDNEVIEEAINVLYNYNFDLINADVLGSIYEDYIGHILKEKEKDLDVIEDYITRKEGGIYYTPTYVVNYIVRNTLGRILTSIETPEDVSGIKVLDPACGSGSFLIKAFDHLNSFYLEYNRKKINEAKSVRTLAGYGHMVGDVSKKILRENLYGVDVDEQAAVIASVNLMLKAIRSGERLPLILGENIRVGNSLIEGKEEELKGYFEDPTSKKPFNWQEQFPKIFTNGGFDVVIGNPPYVRAHLLPNDDKKYFNDHFSSAHKQYDIFVLFIERAINLLKKNGYFSFIVSNKFAVSDYGLKLREKILNECEIDSIVDVSKLPIFKGIHIYPYIIILRKQQDENKRKKNVVKVITGLETEEEFIKGDYTIAEIPQERYLSNPAYLFDIMPAKSYQVVKKIEKNSINLGEVSEITRGFRPPPTDLLLSQDDYETLDSGKKEEYRKFARGEEMVDKFAFNWAGTYVRYRPERIAESKDSNVFEQPKILIRDIALKPEAYYDEDFLYCLKTIYLILQKEKDYDLKFLIGILNSKLMEFYFRSKFWAVHIGGEYLRFRKQFLEILPIRKYNPDTKNQKIIHDAIVKLVDDLLILNRQKYWILYAFQNLLNNFDLTNKVRLSHYYDPRNPDTTHNYGINLVKTWKMDDNEEGIIKQYQVELMASSIVIRIRYKNEVRFRDAIKIFFEDERLRDFFYLALKLNEGTKNYKSKRPTLMTALEDMLVPKYSKSNLIKDNIKTIRNLMKTLETEHKREMKRSFRATPIRSADLSRIVKKITLNLDEIDQNVYKLYSLSEKDISILRRSLL